MHSSDKKPPTSISLIGTTLEISEANASALAAELMRAASTIADLLNQYRLISPKISVETVDYLRDAGAAQKVSSEYKLSSASDSGGCTSA